MLALETVAVKNYAADMKQADGLPATFGEAVRARRTDLGLSQRALAQKMTDLGVPMDATAVTRLENNNREARFSEGLALSRFLSFDPFLYAPKGLSYAGLEAKVSADFKLASSALADLIMSTIEAIGMHRLLAKEEDRLPDDEIGSALVGSVTETITVAEASDFAGVANFVRESRDFERDGALMALREVLALLGVSVEQMNVSGYDPEA